MGRRVNGIEDDALILGGIAVGGYFLLKNVLPDFGASPAEKQAIQNQETLDPSENVFSSQSQVYRDWTIDNLDFNGYDSTTSLYQQLRDMYFQANSEPTTAMGVLGPVVAWGESLYEDLTGFIMPNSVNDAVYILNQIQHKWQVGAIDEYLIDNYGFDVSLWNLLHRGAGFTVKGLNATDLVNAINRLNNLPD